MKNSTIYVLCVLFPLLWGCNDYLKADSDDLLIPTSVNDYAPILIGEAYPDRLWYDLVEQVSLMTDDIEMGPLYYDDAMANRVTEGVDGNSGAENAYTWGTITEDIWENYYSYIRGCNVVIAALPEMTYAEGEYDLYCKLAAQAYTLRAYYYFSLVNLYAAPWSEENLDKPGVVKRVVPDVNTDAAPRATVGEIYALINDDLAKAETYFADARNEYSKYEVSPAAMQFLKSRVALFQEDWDGVIEASQAFIDAGNHEMYDLNEVDLDLCGFREEVADDPQFWINDNGGDEVVFCFVKEMMMYRYFAGASTYLNQNYTLGYHPSWTGENALLNQYEEGDLRRDVYLGRMYYQSGNTYRAYQALPIKGRNVMCAWRSPEVYLNMAEAYARQAEGVSQEAIDVLNEVRAKKLSAATYVAKTTGDFASKEDLVEFIWEERRRELCFDEAMRFWDLRRQGMPEIRHTLHRTDGTQSTYVLEAGSPNYLLQIPVSETDYNTAIEPNPRDIIVGQ